MSRIIDLTELILAGRIRQITVAAGDSVQAGQVLVELE